MVIGKKTISLISMQIQFSRAAFHVPLFYSVWGTIEVIFGLDHVEQWSRVPTIMATLREIAENK
jgi:hypothetical protein